MSASNSSKNRHSDQPGPGRPKRVVLTNDRGQTLGEVLRLARRTSPKRLSQENAAAEVGVSRVAISDYERDAYAPSVATFRQLLDVYEFPERDTGFCVVGDHGSGAEFAASPSNGLSIAVQAKSGSPPRTHRDLVSAFLRQFIDHEPWWPIDAWEAGGDGMFVVPQQDGFDVRYRKSVRLTLQAPQVLTEISGRCIALIVNSDDDRPLFPLASDGDVIVCDFETPDPSSDTNGGSRLVLLRQGDRVVVGMPSKRREGGYETLNPYRKACLHGEWKPIGKPIAVLGYPRAAFDFGNKVKFLLNFNGISTLDFLTEP